MTLELIARHYDLLYNQFEDDIDMWDHLTADIDGPILEVGCGTGRLLLPLARLGHQLSGLDLSDLALQQARQKLETERLLRQVTLHQADMRTFSLDQQFELAFVPLNTFMHCHTVDDQLATLERLHAHLVPGGELVIDLFNPDLGLFAEADGRLYFEDEFTDPTSGNTVQLFWRHDLDLGEQMRHMIYLLDEIQTDGQLCRTRIPFSLRYFHRFEIELLLRAAGFSIEALYGDYDLTDFHGHSPRLIVFAQAIK